MNSSTRTESLAGCSTDSQFELRTAIVAGVVAGKAGNGGNAWTRVSLVLGLRRLGFDAVLIETLPAPPPAKAAYFESVCAEFGFEGFLVGDELPREVRERVEDASLLVN